MTRTFALTMTLLLVTVPWAYAQTANPEPPATEEPKKEEEKFILQKLIESSAAGQTLAGNGWKISGWTQGTYSAGTARASNLPVPYIERARDFSLNQNYLHMEKAIDADKKEVQLGMGIDIILPGTDYRNSIARNLMSDQLLLRNQTYGIDPYQAYIDIFLPNVGGQGTTLRAGKFATFLEYETVQAINTPFASRSYIFQYNPFSHTGVEAITKIDDDWTATNGLVLGNDNFFGNATRATYIGQLKWAPKEGKTSVAFGTSITKPTYDAGQAFNYYNVYNLQVTQKITNKLQYIADACYSHMSAAPGIGFANWYGVANYLLYDVAEQLQCKARLEFFNDEQGYRTGSKGLYSALTYGITWKPTPWLAVMPEVRYDYNAGNSNPGPFEGKRDLFTATFGAIIRW